MLWNSLPEQLRQPDSLNERGYCIRLLYLTHIWTFFSTGINSYTELSWHRLTCALLKTVLLQHIHDILGCTTKLYLLMYLFWIYDTVVAGIHIILEWLLVIGIAWLYTHWTVSSWAYRARESRSPATWLARPENIVQVRHAHWWCAVGWSFEIYQRNNSSRNYTDLDWISKWLSFCVYILIGLYLGWDRYHNLPILPIPILLACSDTDTEYRYRYQELFDDNSRWMMQTSV